MLSPQRTAAAGPPQGVDVSEFQGTITWSSVRAGNISFAYIRAGDGSGYNDPKFATNWSGARSVGIIPGAYLFYEPNEDPAAQANLLLDQLHAVGFRQGDLVPAIDVETMDGQSADTVVANLQTTVGIVGHALGQLPAIYAAPSWWDGNVHSSAFTDSPLWVANWCGCGAPSVPAGNWGGHGWSVWQYSDAGSIPGISGNVDLDTAGGPAGFPFYEPFRPLVGAVSTTVGPDGTELLFWQDPGSHDIFEGWFTGGNWYGPADLSLSQLGGITTASAPVAQVTPDGSQQLLFWRGPADHLFEAWWAAGAWNGPIDLTSQFPGSVAVTSAPSVAVTPDGSQQLVFWQGGDGHLWEAWFAAGRWNGPVDWTRSAMGPAAQPASAPSVAVTPDGTQELVFWQGGDGHLYEAWWGDARWNGPVDWTSGALAGAQLASAPSVVATPDGSQELVFWRAPNGDLEEAWWGLSRWNGPADWTGGAFGGTGPLASAPSAAATPDRTQELVFWQGTSDHLWEAWFAGGRWNGPVDFTNGG